MIFTHYSATTICRHRRRRGCRQVNMIVCLFLYSVAMLRAKHMSVKSIRIGTQIQPEDENYFYLLPDTRHKNCKDDRICLSENYDIVGEYGCMGVSTVDVTPTRIVNSIKWPNRFTFSD